MINDQWQLCSKGAFGWSNLEIAPVWAWALSSVEAEYVVEVEVVQH
jgi:hypothetical protein